MDQEALPGLRVAKYHAFDEVARRQKPLETHGLLKAGIGPKGEDRRLPSGASESVITIMRNR